MDIELVVNQVAYRMVVAQIYRDFKVRWACGMGTDARSDLGG